MCAVLGSLDQRLVDIDSTNANVRATIAPQCASTPMCYIARNQDDSAWIVTDMFGAQCIACVYDVVLKLVMYFAYYCVVQHMQAVTCTHRPLIGHTSMQAIACKLAEHASYSSHEQHTYNKFGIWPMSDMINMFDFECYSDPR